MTLTKKSFEHVRTRIELDCRWVRAERVRPFRRLSLHAPVGTGPACQAVDAKLVAVLAGAAYLLE